MINVLKCNEIRKCPSCIYLLNKVALSSLNNDEAACEVALANLIFCAPGRSAYTAGDVVVNTRTKTIVVASHFTLLNKCILYQWQG